MNAVHMMVSQAGVAFGGVLWGSAATSFGVEKALFGGTVLLIFRPLPVVLLSINFAQSLDFSPAPFRGRHDFPEIPKPEDGPVTVAR